MSHINNASLTNDGAVTNDEGNDYFGFELKYNNPGGQETQAQYNGNISMTSWKTLGSEKQHYVYQYDQLNRLKTARYTHTGNPLLNGKFDEHIEAYDRNGNIKILKRGVNGATDYLDYEYAGNQLLKVTDSGNETGFKDGTQTGNDYAYDSNGNMKLDWNKEIADIRYNYLNLPEQIFKTNGDQAQYLYSAGGVKLKQVAIEGGVTKTTDYAGGFVYENNEEQFAMHSEGRVTWKENGPVYDYFIKDHLSNVRVTLTSEEITRQYTAGFESGNQETEAGEFENYPSGGEINPVATNASSGTNSELLNGGYSGQVGITKSFSVMPGDEVSIQAYVKYETPSGTDTDFNGFVSSLISAFNLSAPAAGETGTAASGVQAFGAWELGEDGNQNQDDPMKLFVTIILFDRDYNFIDAAYSSPGNSGDLISASYTVKEPGYAYLYISNEHPYLTRAYFDDVVMTHTFSPIIQQSDNYPFGLQFNSYSRENSVANKYKYQGQEHIDDLNLGWDSFKWRNHQADIGRFFNIDPLASRYACNSPYAFSENDVVNCIELEGLETFRYINYSPMQSKELKEEFNKIKGLELYEDVGDNKKIKKSRSEVQRILDYGMNHGFFDPSGDKARYIIKKLKESGLKLPITVEENNSTTDFEKIREDGEWKTEYYGVEENANGRLQLKKLGEINHDAEYDKLKWKIFQLIPDSWPIPLWHSPIYKDPNWDNHGKVNDEPKPPQPEPPAPPPPPLPDPTVTTKRRW